MRLQSSELADDEEQDAWVGNVGIRRAGDGAIGAVDPEGHVQAGEKPVVGRVSEDVEDRHCCGGEAMEEEGFELAFEEVGYY